MREHKGQQNRENTASSLQLWKTLVRVEGNQAGLHTLNFVSHPATETSTNPYVEKKNLI